MYARYGCERVVPFRRRFGPGALIPAAILTLFAASIPDLSAQTLNFRQYTNADGLPQTQVFTIHQDRAGYLWFGTFGGMAQYDGSTFRTFTTADGLAANVVNDLAEGPDGALYVATSGGGLCRRLDEMFSCRTARDGFPSDVVWRVTVAPDGSIWVAGEGHLIRIRGEEVESYPAPMISGSREGMSLAADDVGGVWLGTTSGLYRWDGDGLVPVRHPLVRDQAVALILPPRGESEPLVVGTHSALYRVDGPEAIEPIPLESAGLPSGAILIQGDRGGDGTLWISTTVGILRVGDDRATLLTTEHGLPGTDHWIVRVDREGNVWLGSNGGATKFVPGPFRNYGLEHGVPDPLVWTLARDEEGRLWAGTHAGVGRRDPGAGRFSTAIPAEALPAPSVFTMAAAPEGGMLMGTAVGLVHWDEGAVRHLTPADGLPHPWIARLLPDREGGVWVATGEGVARWWEGRVVPLPEDHPLRELRAFSLEYDSAGRLWIGLLSGGVRIWDGTRLEALGLEDGLSDQAIWSLAPDGEGGMWVATNGEGAFRVSGLSVVDRVNRESGLVNDFVWQILTDSRGDTWMYTSHGVARLSADGYLDHFGPGDGLLALEGAGAAILEDPDGTIWFGSTAGVLAYDPTEEQISLIPPVVKIREVLLSGELLATVAPLRFRDGLLQLRFTALSFRDEQRMAFRYRLLGGGSSGEWSAALPDRTVTFAGLRPGSYTFEVVAINRYGVESTEPNRLSFTVTPAFWQTYWFQGGLALLLLGILTAYPIRRSRRLERDRRRLEATVGERTADLESANRKLRVEMEERERMGRALRQAQKMEAVGQLAGGLAHQFNNRLTSILGITELVSLDLPTDDPARDELGMVTAACREMAGTVEQLLALSRKQMVSPGSLPVHDALRAIHRRLVEAAGDGVSLVLEPAQGDEPWIFMNEGQFEQILLHLVQNAGEAMANEGTVILRTRIERLDEAPAGWEGEAFQAGEYVVIEVEDTGVGMTEETVSRAFEPFFTTRGMVEATGMGLSIVYGVVTQNGGMVRLRSTPGDGCTVILRFPAAPAHPRSSTGVPIGATP